MDDNIHAYRILIARALVELETGDPREAAKILRSVTDPAAAMDARPVGEMSHEEYLTGWPFTETQFRG